MKSTVYETPDERPASEIAQFKYTEHIQCTWKDKTNAHVPAVYRPS